MEKKNKLPDSWVVKNDGSQRFKDLVIKYMNENSNTRWKGYDSYYYGQIGGEFFCVYSSHHFQQVITLDQFEEMIKDDEHDHIGFTIQPEKALQIAMTLETAREFWKTANEITRKWLLGNFSEEDLEVKKGFTWEDSFKGKGYYIRGTSEISEYEGVLMIQKTNKNVFRTEVHAQSALAFAQLSHIVAKYNDLDLNNLVYKDGAPFFYYVTLFDGKNLGINSYPKVYLHLPFYTYESAKTSMEVNNELWKQYWMI